MIKRSEIENQDVKDTLEMADSMVLNNSDLITPELLGQDYVLHIAKQKFTSLKPNVSRRSLDGENNTLPRVCVSANLIDCMRGYGGFVKEISQPIDRKETNYRGGFYIYAIPFEYLIKPNEKLVPEAKRTNELWLFSYNKDTAVFRPRDIDLLVLKEMRITGGTPSNFIEEITLCVRNESNKPIALTKEKVIKPGTYQLKIRQYYGRSATIEVADMRSIDPKEFDSIKKQYTALESHSSFPLAFNAW